MFQNQLPAPNKQLLVPAEPVSVVLVDEGNTRLSFILPPLAELREIRELSSKNYSLYEDVEAARLRKGGDFAEELKSLLKKRDRFSESATYFTRLANLAEFAGDLSSEGEFLANAARVSVDVSFQHKIGSNLIARGQTDEAKGLFESLDLEHDLHANLRLAFLAAERNKLDEASTFVSKALHIDPTNFGARLFAGALALNRGELRWAILNFKLAAEERQTSSVFTNLAIAYVLMHRFDKAFSVLRKAIALEPFSVHAVALFADLAFLEKRDREAIRPLENFLQLEQKNAAIWGLLARALIEIGNYRKALDALKRQASLDESSAVFNNLGVVNALLGEKKKAGEYFNYAIQKSKESSTDYLLAARNLLAILAEMGRFPEMLKIAKQTLAASDELDVARHPVFSDIYSFLISSLVRVDGRKEASRTAKHLLRNVPDLAPGLKVWLSTGLIADLAMSREKWPEALEYAQEGMKMAPMLAQQDKRVDALKNNFAFLLLEMGRIDEAEALISQISRWIHVDPYPTATLGLLHILKGHLEKGEALYHEAIQLANTMLDRQRIAQKMHLELGRVLMEKDKRQAKLHFLRASKDSGPIREISEEAKKLMASQNICVTGKTSD